MPVRTAFQNLNPRGASPAGVGSMAVSRFQIETQAAIAEANLRQRQAALKAEQDWRKDQAKQRQRKLKAEQEIRRDKAKADKEAERVAKGGGAAPAPAPAPAPPDPALMAPGAVQPQGFGPGLAPAAGPAPGGAPPWAAALGPPAQAPSGQAPQQSSPSIPLGPLAPMPAQPTAGAPPWTPGFVSYQRGVGTPGYTGRTPTGPTWAEELASQNYARYQGPQVTLPPAIGEQDGGRFLPEPDEQGRPWTPYADEAARDTIQDWHKRRAAQAEAFAEKINAIRRKALTEPIRSTMAKEGGPSTAPKVLRGPAMWPTGGDDVRVGGPAVKGSIPRPLPPIPHTPREGLSPTEAAATTAAGGMVLEGAPRAGDFAIPQRAQPQAPAALAATPESKLPAVRRYGLAKRRHDALIKRGLSKTRAFKALDKQMGGLKDDAEDTVVAHKSLKLNRDMTSVVESHNNHVAAPARKGDRQGHLKSTAQAMQSLYADFKGYTDAIERAGVSGDRQKEMLTNAKAELQDAVKALTRVPKLGSRDLGVGGKNFLYELAQRMPKQPAETSAQYLERVKHEFVAKTMARALADPKNQEKWADFIAIKSGLSGTLSQEIATSFMAALEAKAAKDKGK